MLTIIFRLINSFEFSTVFYVVLKDLPETTTLEEVKSMLTDKVQTEGKYRPVRRKILRFDTFKVYGKAGQAKSHNLTIAPTGREYHGEELGHGLADLGIENEMEVSFYIDSDYQAWKQ
eukprot:gnl/Dysnectes_brevis/3139_a3908_1479.p1 GENE.gnl/Dysnectes_brevis/3139_a3908_1479~~gnl/Dysnectes_brevis/3139_a3908_1479.p1  ORF type:complete len:118 (-),score=9.91 gnl/Dysnectes_brevis/3139_a3908_1479:86-439(-)